MTTDVRAAVEAVAKAGALVSTRRLALAFDLTEEQVNEAREWLASNRELPEAPETEARKRLRIATADEKEAIKATATRIRGEVRYLPDGCRAALLPVVNTRFGWDDLTPRAAVRAILREPATRRVFFGRGAAS